jgi:hypothetical protein
MPAAPTMMRAAKYRPIDISGHFREVKSQCRLIQSMTVSPISPEGDAQRFER